MIVVVDIGTKVLEVPVEDIIYIKSPGIIGLKNLKEYNFLNIVFTRK